MKHILILLPAILISSMGFAQTAKPKTSVASKAVIEKKQPEIKSSLPAPKGGVQVFNVWHDKPAEEQAVLKPVNETPPVTTEVPQQPK